MSLSEELRAVINRHNAEQRSNTPDFILASYLLSCLRAFEAATISRDDWYGERQEPGRASDPRSATDLEEK